MKNLIWLFLLIPLIGVSQEIDYYYTPTTDYYSSSGEYVGYEETTIDYGGATTTSYYGGDGSYQGYSETTPTYYSTEPTTTTTDYYSSEGGYLGYKEETGYSRYLSE